MPDTLEPPSTLQRLHRLSGFVLAAFIAAHLFNHALAIVSVEKHIAFMESFRSVYRAPLAEVLLLGAVLFQICSGLYFLKARWGQRRSLFDRLQAISGGYLVFFFINHVGAIIVGRAVLDLDTNFYFAAAGMHISPFWYFFVPYYFLAVVAVFAHLACAFHWLTRERLGPSVRNGIGFVIISLGAVTSLLIVSAFAGSFYDMKIPPEYMAPYGEDVPH